MKVMHSSFRCSEGLSSGTFTPDLTVTGTSTNMGGLGISQEATKGIEISSQTGFLVRKSFNFESCDGKSDDLTIPIDLSRSLICIHWI